MNFKQHSLLQYILLESLFTEIIELFRSEDSMSTSLPDRWTSLVYLGQDWFGYLFPHLYRLAKQPINSQISIQVYLTDSEWLKCVFNKIGVNKQNSSEI